MKRLKEVFLPVPIAAYQGIYEIGSHGTLKRLGYTATLRSRYGKLYTRWMEERIISQWENNKGHIVLSLIHPETRKILKRNVHQLVAMAFVDNPNGFEFVIHKNGKLGDNYFKNLEWADNKLVMEHTKKKGLLVGRDNRQKIEYADAVCIRKRCANGEKQMRVANDYGLSQQHINNIVHYRTWKEDPDIKFKRRTLKVP